MTALLVILNPRRIPEAVESFNQLDIDKAWLTGWYESQLGPVMDELVGETRYDHYVVASDDLRVPQSALDAVLRLLEGGEPVATGWCPLDETSQKANLCKSKLKGEEGPHGYDFYNCAEIEAWPAEKLPTWFAGMCLTGMTRDLWLEFPFRALRQIVTPGRVYPEPRGHKGLFNKGFGSDWFLSKRLTDAGHAPFAAARDGRCEHLKAEWNEVDWRPGFEILCGKVEPQTRMEAKACA